MSQRAYVGRVLAAVNPPGLERMISVSVAYNQWYRGYYADANPVEYYPGGCRNVGPGPTTRWILEGDGCDRFGRRKLEDCRALATNHLANRKGPAWDAVLQAALSCRWELQGPAS